MTKNFQNKREGSYFSRFEIKYILNKELSENIQKKITDFMVYDGFAGKSIDKKYFVRSLYFDNNSYHNFHQKIDGLKIRHKFRIRTYSKKNAELSKIFLEKKGRFNERTFKIRRKILNNSVKYFLCDTKLVSLKNKYKKDKLVDEFIFDVYKKRIKPKVLIDYYRKPFINKNGVYFRLTFDSNITACHTDNLYADESEFKQTIPGFDVLEVKFDRTIPPWFQKIIQSFELKRLSVSKFVLGCEATNLAYDYDGK